MSNVLGDRPLGEAQPPPTEADILWWHIFVDNWNGISLLWDIGL